MSEIKADSNGEAADIAVRELVLEWGNNRYKLTADIVAKAFDKADYGDLLGPHARYFVDCGGDLKPLEEVFRQIVPIPKDRMPPEVAETVSDILRSLGFSVLDRRRHHEF